MTRYNYFQNQFISWAMLLFIAVVTFASCSKEGTPETMPEFSKVTFKVRTLKQAPVLYELKVGDYTVDGSITKTQEYTRAIERSAVEQRLLVTERISNTILLDTMVVIPPLGATYTIYQVDTAENVKPFFIVSGQQNDIPADTYMQAFYVNNPKYPPAIDINVYEVAYNSTTGELTKFELVHAFDDVQHKELTEFIPLAIQETYRIEVLASNGDPIPLIPPVDPVTGQGGMLYQRCNYTDSNYQVSLFLTQTLGPFTIYAMECMFQY